MIPQVTLPDYEIVSQPSRTWRLDPDTKRVAGTVAGVDAVLQAAWLTLLTPRYRHLIYSWAYGSELDTLIGTDADFAFSEAQRMISEALLADPRITDVRDFVRDGGALRFVIDTIFGPKELETEVISLANL